MVNICYCYLNLLLPLLRFLYHDFCFVVASLLVVLDSLLHTGLLWASELICLAAGTIF